MPVDPRMFGTFPPDHEGIPTYSGRDARRSLFRRWGIPNAAPRPVDSLFGVTRVLFVDDFDDGRPVAYWVPDLTPKTLRRRLAEGDRP